MTTAYTSTNQNTPPEPQDTDSLMASNQMELKENPEYAEQTPIDYGHPAFKNWQNVEIIGGKSL